MLSDFRIQRFRAFADLLIPKLGRVNLIVGKNSVGKSTVLEAINLFATGGSSPSIARILVDRDDVAIKPRRSERELLVAALFHGRSLPRNGKEMIHIGPPSAPDTLLTLGADFVRHVPIAENGAVVGSRLEPVSADEASNDASVELALKVEQYGEKRYVRPPYYGGPYVRRDPRSIPAIVPASGVSDSLIARWWDAVVLRDAEDRVAACLKLIAPVDRISFVERPDKSAASRMAMVRLQGSAEPVPLKTLGDGFRHVFQIALAFEHVGRGRISREPTLFGMEPLRTDGFVMFDEVENGVHYSIHAQVWTAIFQMAAFHDVQVFATTHSWDCIEGFQIAAAADKKNQGVLLRLEHRHGKHDVVTFTEEELAIVARDEIEVR